MLERQRELEEQYRIALARLNHAAEEERKRKQEEADEMEENYRNYLREQEEKYDIDDVHIEENIDVKMLKDFSEEGNMQILIFVLFFAIYVYLGVFIYTVF